MEMTRDALELIQKTAQTAQHAVKLDVPGDGRRMFVQHGQELREIAVLPGCRNHEVRSLNDLITYAQEAADLQTRSDTAGNPVVWHDVDRVVLVLDDSDRRDCVTFPLEFSDAWKLLTKLDVQPCPIDQKSFVRMLRLDFGVAADIVNQFRKLDWESKIQTRGEVQRGRESLGRDIEAEVKGTADLPEELILVVPMYKQLGERETYTVRCVVEYDHGQQRIILAPEAEVLTEIEDAHQGKIEQRIVDGLDGADVAVYYGKP